jgi:outer membrane protein OmpA-like peptidoglycan-associated protein
MRYSIVFILLLLVPAATYAQAAQETHDPDKPLIKSVYFGGGSYFVDGEQVVSLQDFITTNIPDINQYVISIHSHTDNIGGEQYNKWLSEMRSESVIYELILQKVPLDNIMIRDFGMNNPVFNNDTWNGKRNNRRVDILFEKVVF